MGRMVLRRLPIPSKPGESSETSLKWFESTDIGQSPLTSSRAVKTARSSACGFGL